MSRSRLPDRRNSISGVYEHGGIKDHCSASYQNGAVAELFLDGPHIGSAANIVAKEAAVLLSLALQHGTPLETIRAALPMLPDASPAGPVGAALAKLK